jgi:hypothetical protein
MGAVGRWWRHAVVSRGARIAVVLWIVLAFLVWNVVFDRVLVLAGRRYVHDAAIAADSGHYLLINDVMPAAIARGAWLASASAAGILALGLAGIRVATRRREPRGHAADSPAALAVPLAPNSD